MNEVDYELTRSDAVIYKDYTNEASLYSRTDDENSSRDNIDVVYMDDIDDTVHKLMSIIYG